MRVELDLDVCQGHARCVAILPELFEVDDTGYARLRAEVVPAGLEDDAREAAAACPERAIALLD